MKDILSFYWSIAFLLQAIGFGLLDVLFDHDVGYNVVLLLLLSVAFGSTQSTITNLSNKIEELERKNREKE